MGKHTNIFTSFDAIASGFFISSASAIKGRINIKYQVSSKLPGAYTNWYQNFSRFIWENLNQI